MIVKSIELENIRSHRHTLIKFPKASILLAGDIGSGKSTILAALEFALFGLQKGEIEGKSLLRHGSEVGKVRAELFVNGKDVVITRELTKKKNSYTQSEVVLEVDGKKERLSVEEINEKIVRLLNLPDAKRKNLIYRFTVYTPQEQMKRILEEKPDVRLNIIRKIFNIDKYKRVAENVEIYAKELRNEIRMMKNELKDVEEIKKAIEALEKEKKELEKAVREFGINVKSLEEELKRAEKEFLECKAKVREMEEKAIMLSKLKAKVEEKRRSVERLAKEIGEIDVKKKEELAKTKADYEARMAEIEKELRDMKKSVAELREKREEIVKAEHANNAKIEQYKQEIEESLQLDICPKCKQKVSEQHKQQMTKKMQDAIERLKEEVKKQHEEGMRLRQEIESLEKSIEKKMEQERILAKSLKDVELAIARYNEYEHKLSLKRQLEEEIAEMEEEIKKVSVDESEYRRQKQLAEKKEEEVNKLKEKVYDARLKLARAEENLKANVKSIEEKKKQLEQKREVEEKIKLLEAFEHWLTEFFVSLMAEIEKKIFYAVNKHFEALLERWFKLLVEEGLEVKLLDDFTPLVEQNQYQCDYSELSGGERTALALAYRLALNQLINMLTNFNLKLIILDEPTEGFSQKQLERMGKVFEELKVEQLIVVSHDPKIEAFVDSIIRLRKENGVSYVL
jgi:exonuclease SbcC